MKIKMRTIAECNECGYRYTAPPWEPTWLGLIAYQDGHDTYHSAMDVMRPEYHPLVIQWREWERERIIALLEAEGVLNGSAISDNWSRAIIALIKGENE